MRSLLFAVAAAFIALPAAAQSWPGCGTVDEFPGATWQEEDFNTLDQYGWDWTYLHVARRMFLEMDSNAVMIVHRGRLIAQWGDVDERYVLQSVRKSILSSLVGQAEARGDLSLDMTLAELGIDDSDPPLTMEERTATIEDLLMSRSGIMHRAGYEVPGHQRNRDRLGQIKLENPGVFAPGNVWTYNNWDFNMMGLIVQQTTGESLSTLFERDVARPIGMEDFRPQDAYFINPGDLAERAMGNRTDHPAYMFSMSTRDLARYGLMFLNCGNWDGTQVVQRDWVRRSIAAAHDVNDGLPEGISIEGRSDYGYHWWVDRPGARMYSTLHVAEPYYFGTGGRGHEIFVFPALDLVIAHQVPTRGTGLFAQLSRRFLGAPSAPEYQVGLLLRTIIQGHPDADTAFTTNESDD